VNFTDEDLKKLKERIAFTETLNMSRDNFFPSLLYRLQCAEEVLNNLRGHDAETVDEDLMRRWKQSAGKEG
jgi:hypothetical protein